MSYFAERMKWPLRFCAKQALGFLEAEWRLFALGHDLHAIGRDAEARQVVPHRRRALFAERQVVLVRAARVAVPFNDDLRRRPALQPLRVLRQ